MQINTHFRRPVTRLRHFTQPSLTVPDQTMSLKTMVTKYVKGLPISAPNLDGIYTDDEDAIDFEKLDLAEQEEAILRASDELTETKGRVTKAQADKAAEVKKQAEKQASEIEDLRNQLEKLKH